VLAYVIPLSSLAYDAGLLSDAVKEQLKSFIDNKRKEWWVAG
jgi:hypothetical protein